MPQYFFSPQKNTGRSTSMPPSLCSLWSPRHLKWHFTQNMLKWCWWKTPPMQTLKFVFMMVSQSWIINVWFPQKRWLTWPFFFYFFCCVPHLGAKTHKTSELVRVVEKSGKSYTVKGEVGLSGLSPESRMYVELSDDGHSMCLSLEAAITAEEQRSANKVPFFPITIGRWEKKFLL